MNPPINETRGAYGEIIRQLREVRKRAARGELPAFRRGRMEFDFDINKVRIMPVDREAA